MRENLLISAKKIDVYLEVVMPGPLEIPIPRAVVRVTPSAVGVGVPMMEEPPAPLMPM